MIEYRVSSTSPDDLGVAASFQLAENRITRSRQRRTISAIEMRSRQSHRRSPWYRWSHACRYRSSSALGLQETDCQARSPAKSGGMFRQSIITAALNSCRFKLSGILPVSVLHKIQRYLETNILEAFSKRNLFTYFLRQTHIHIYTCIQTQSLSLSPNNESTQPLDRSAQLVSQDARVPEMNVFLSISKPEFSIILILSQVRLIISHIHSSRSTL